MINKKMLRPAQLVSVVILISGLISANVAVGQSSNWEVPESADTLENPLDQKKEIIKAGQNIFNQLCTVCHGKAGKGDGVTAATLKPKPADLTSKELQQQTDGAFYWKIKEGRPPMPSFESQLSEKQIWAVVTYIRSLKKDK